MTDSEIAETVRYGNGPSFSLLSQEPSHRDFKDALLRHSLTPVLGYQENEWISVDDDVGFPLTC